jgi:hypothetical protein
VKERRNMGYPAVSSPTLSVTNLVGHGSVTLAPHG